MSFMTLITMVGLILSKGSGFLRDMLVARNFGEVYADAFYMAFNIPDLVFNLLVMGAIQSAVTPMLSSSIAKGQEKKGLHIVSTFLTVAAIMMLAVSSVCFIFAEESIKLFVDPKPGTLELAAKASRILYPQIFFMMLAALEIGVLNAYKRFGSTSFGPTIYNIGVVLSIAIFAKDNETRLLLCMTGILISAVIYFIFQFVVGRDKLSLIRPNLDIFDPEFKVLLKRAFPILLSQSIVQINLMVTQRFATGFDDGMIRCLKNAQTVWQLPYGIFAVAVGNVMLPSMSALYASKKYKDVSDLLSSRLKTALFMTIPSSAILLVNRFDVIRVLFKWSDNYTQKSIEYAGVLLMGYCIAVITQSVVFIFNQAFYATGKTRVPLFSGILSAVINPFICWLLLKIGFGLLSITIAYSVASIIQMIFLIWLFNSYKSMAPKNILPFILKSGVCLIMMILVMYLMGFILPYAGDYGKLMQIVILGLKVLAGMIVYFTAACLIRMNEALYWIRKVVSRLGIKI